MAGKTFGTMTLDEIFEFEGKHPFDLGRGVVTRQGFERNRARLDKAIRTLPKRRKRSAAKPASV